MAPDRRMSVPDLHDLPQPERAALAAVFGTAPPPPLARALARHPATMGTLMTHLQTVMAEGAVPGLLKELLAVRVASIAHCRSQLARHTAAARTRGAPPHWLLAIRHEEPEPGTGRTGSLDDMEKDWVVALRYAEQLADAGLAVTDDVHRKLSGLWDDRQIVEISHVIGLVGYLCRLADALDVPPEG